MRHLIWTGEARSTLEWMFSSWLLLISQSGTVTCEKQKASANNFPCTFIILPTIATPRVSCMSFF